MSLIMEQLDKIIAVFAILGPLIYKSFRSNRINDANKAWIKCLIFIVVEGIPFSTNGLRCIKTGIAETHNVYTAEMLSEEAAMRAACGIIVNDTNYSKELCKRFFLLYPYAFSKMLKCGTKEKETPLITQRKITFIFMVLYFVVLGILVFNQQIWNTIINGNLFSEETLGYIWTFISADIILSGIITILAEKFSPPRVNYHQEYQSQTGEISSGANLLVSTFSHCFPLAKVFKSSCAASKESCHGSSGTGCHIAASSVVGAKEKAR